MFPECNVDTNLVGFLVGGFAKHKSCCNEVVKAVNNSDSFAIGIIDADKRQATMDPGFREYMLSEPVDGEKRHVAMFVHDDRKRFMFTIKPAMDKLVWDAAKQQGVSMRDAGYPSTFEGFKKETKRVQAATDPKLRRLFDMISDYPELQRLKNTLKYLVNMQYESNADVAKQFFDGSLTSGDLPILLSGTSF